MKSFVNETTKPEDVPPVSNFERYFFNASNDGYLINKTELLFVSGPRQSGFSSCGLIFMNNAFTRGSIKHTGSNSKILGFLFRAFFLLNVFKSYADLSFDLAVSLTRFFRRLDSLFSRFVSRQLVLLSQYYQI
jgi:hypothetical protein